MAEEVVTRITAAVVGPNSVVAILITVVCTQYTLIDV